MKKLFLIFLLCACAPIRDIVEKPEAPKAKSLWGPKIERLYQEAAHRGDAVFSRQILRSYGYEGGDPIARKLWDKHVIETKTTIGNEIDWLFYPQKHYGAVLYYQNFIDSVEASVYLDGKGVRYLFIWENDRWTAADSLIRERLRVKVD